MLRTTAIAKELATIERKLKETDNATLKEALKKKETRLKAELKDQGKSTTQLAKTLLAQREVVKQLSKVEFNDLIRRLSKKPEYAFLKTMSKSTVKNDLQVTAKPVGWRFKGRGNYDKPTKAEILKGKKNGTVYREVRPIRSDVSQIVRLKEGGEVDESDKKILSYLKSMQTSEAEKILAKYEKAREEQGSYGQRPAIHTFMIENIVFDGKKYSALVTQTYSYQNFTNIYGETPSVWRLSLFEGSTDNKIGVFLFTKDKWDEVSKKLKNSMYAEGGGVKKYTVKKESGSVVIYENGERYGKLKTLYNWNKNMKRDMPYIAVIRFKDNKKFDTTFAFQQDVFKYIKDTGELPFTEDKMMHGGSMYAKGGEIKSLEKQADDIQDRIDFLIEDGVDKHEDELIQLGEDKQAIYRKINELKGKKYAKGGSLEQESLEMINNQAISAKHHIEELKEVLSHQKHIEPWVIAKMQRATTDLSDITHYLDGKDPKMAFGGIVYDLSNDAIDRMEGLAPNDSMQIFNNNVLEIYNSFEEEGFEKDEIASFLSYKIVQHLNKMMHGGEVEPLGYKHKDAVEYGKKLVDRGAKTIEIRNKIEENYAGLRGEIQSIMNDVLDYKESKMMHGGSIEVGDKVKASKEYGGKSGTVIEKRGSFVVVEDSKGRTESYHESDLIKKMAQGGEVSFTDYKGESIMFEPHFKEYYVGDAGPFNTLDEAKEYIDGGSQTPDSIKDAYKKGLFARGGKLTAAQQKKFDKVMHEWGEGKLRSGSEDGPIVKDQDQALAIAYAEANASKMAQGGGVDSIEPSFVIEVNEINNWQNNWIEHYAKDINEARKMRDEAEERLGSQYAVGLRKIKPNEFATGGGVGYKWIDPRVKQLTDKLSKENKNDVVKIVIDYHQNKDQKKAIDQLREVGAKYSKKNDNETARNIAEIATIIIEKSKKSMYKVAYAGKGFYGITNGGEIIGEMSKEEAQKEADKKNSKSTMGWKHKSK